MEVAQRSYRGIKPVTFAARYGTFFQRYGALSDVVTFRGRSMPLGLALAPSPVRYFRHVIAVLGDVVLVLEELVRDRLLGVGRARPELGQAVDHVAHEVEAVEIVHDDHVERRARRALFLVAAHVQVLVVRSTIREPMDEPRIAVERE